MFLGHHIDALNERCASLERKHASLLKSHEKLVNDARVRIVALEQSVKKLTEILEAVSSR